MRVDSKYTEQTVSFNFPRRLKLHPTPGVFGLLIYLRREIERQAKDPSFHVGATTCLPSWYIKPVNQDRNPLYSSRKGSLLLAPPESNALTSSHIREEE